MPLYPFACSDCGLQFDVSREAADVDRPAQCPLDGAEARRVETLTPMKRRDGSQLERRERRDLSWAAFMHDHGPGTPPHPHGGGTPFHRS